MPNHALEREIDAPEGRNFSRVREGHAPASDGQTNMLLKAARNGGTHEHSEVACLWLRFPEKDRSNFLKIKSKIFRNRLSSVPGTKKTRFAGVAEQRNGR
jgi:hypothetical protein